MGASRLPFGLGIAVGVAGGVIGTLAWQSLAGSTPVPLPAAAAEFAPRAAGGDAARAAPSERRAEGTAPVPGRADADSPAYVVARVSTDPFGAALRDHAIAEARRGWREVRGDAMPDDVLQELLADYEQ